MSKARRDMFCFSALGEERRSGGGGKVSGGVVG